jgi:hypothetical protein
MLPDPTRRTSTDALFDRDGEEFNPQDEGDVGPYFFEGEPDFQISFSDELNQGHIDFASDGPTDFQDVLNGWGSASPTNQESFESLIDPALLASEPAPAPTEASPDPPHPWVVGPEQERGPERSADEFAIASSPAYFAGVEAPPLYTPDAANFNLALMADGQAQSPTASHALPFPQLPQAPADLPAQGDLVALPRRVAVDCVNPNLISIAPTSAPIEPLEPQTRGTGPEGGGLVDPSPEYTEANGNWDQGGRAGATYMPDANGAYNAYSTYQVATTQYPPVQFQSQLADHNVVYNAYPAPNGFPSQYPPLPYGGTTEPPGTHYPSPPVKHEVVAYQNEILSGISNPPTRPPTAHQSHLQGPIPQQANRYPYPAHGGYLTAPTSRASTVAPPHPPGGLPLGAVLPELDGSDLISNKRLDSHDPAKVQHFYRPIPVHEIPRPWGPNNKFRYTNDGEWEPDVLLTSDDLKFYIQAMSLKDPDMPPDLMRSIRCNPAAHPNEVRRLQDLPDRLVIWVQNPPAQLSWRYASAKSSKCRYVGCRDKNHTILKGFWRVCFDEHPTKTGVEYDPFRNAGYMHLWCFEKATSVPILMRASRGLDPRYPGWIYTNTCDIFRGDCRRFRFEKENPMSLIRDHAGCQDEFAAWAVKEMAEIDNHGEHNKRKTCPRQFKKIELENKKVIVREVPSYADQQSLWHALTIRHLGGESKGRAAVREHRQGNDIGVHKGQLRIYCDAVEKRRRVEKKAKKGASHKARNFSFDSTSSSDGPNSPKRRKRPADDVDPESEPALQEARRSECYPGDAADGPQTRKRRRGDSCDEEGSPKRPRK